MRRGTLVTVSSIHTALGGAMVLCLQRCTMRCQIELCAGVIYLIRGQDTQIIELQANVRECFTIMEKDTARRDLLLVKTVYYTITFILRV